MKPEVQQERSVFKKSAEKTQTVDRKDRLPKSVDMIEIANK